MGLSDVLSNLLVMVGLKPSEARQMQRLREKLKAARAANTDRIEDVKAEIRQYQTRLKKLAKEHEAALGDGKRPVAREIERAVRDLDRLRGREEILHGNLEKISLALSKTQELAAAKEQGLDEEAIDSLTLDIEDAFADLRRTDRAAEGLERAKYSGRDAEPVDADQRVAELDRGEPAARDRGADLSPEARRKLKELEELET
jgi:uncharacterized protein YhaN